MKQLIFSAAFALFTTAAFAQSETPATLPIGSAIPEASMKMKATDGKTYSLGQVKTDAGLLVMFSCNTCPYVVKSQARTIEAMKMASVRGIGMVVINSNDAQRGKEDSYDAMKKYAKANNYSVPYVVDEKSKIADAFGATRTPEVFLFDASGKLVYSGAMEDNPSEPAASKELYLTDALRNVNTAAISPATTKSIGCSIKRSK